MTPEAQHRFAPLVLADVPLAGRTLIEASAGTGKTWTIVALYLRLLLEKRLPVENILVVTYTKAATAELKARILARLIELRDEQQDDPWLALAVESFDQAPVFTIHGFCQRALAEQAFESGMAFDTEILADDARLVETTVQDCWRREMAAAHPLWAAWLRKQRITPAVLADRLATMRRKPYATLLLPPAPRADAELDYANAYAAARAAWQAGADDAWAQLDQWPLDRRSYNVRNMARWRDELTRCLSGAQPPIELPETVERFTAHRLAAKSKNGEAPGHPIFAALERAWDALASLHAAFDARLAHWCARIADESAQAMRALKAERGLQGYDDLLGNLQRSLAGKQGRELAAALRGRYGAALIDEFQDTDPIQYDIFHRIYAASAQPLYFVGDPKQAIYGFRGADVHAYLDARRAADARLTLATNYRSTPALVNAVNSIFARGDDPFLVEEIGFTPVLTAEREREALVIDDEDDAALTFWLAPRDADGTPLKKGPASELAATATAGEIARLLHLARAGRAMLGSRALEGGDIAVLVFSHRQARMVKEALAALGIASVSYGQDSVYRSSEAEEVARVIAAVAEPAREGSVRAALATEMLGWSGDDLAALADDTAQWEVTLARFGDYHRMMRERGFIFMWRALIAREDVPARLLALPEGERRLTNVQHLSDLLQQAALEQGLDLEGLARWLARERERPTGDADVQALRLESDEHLVKVLTVHASKGLEFPLVFCPFLWDGRLRSANDELVAFHDHEHGRLAIDLGSPQLDAHRQAARREELAERLRLAYVALTRAKHRCVVVWGAIKDAESSALAWLLHRPARSGGDPLGALAARFDSLDDAALRAEIEALDGVRATVVPAPGLGAGPQLRPGAIQSDARMAVSAVVDSGLRRNDEDDARVFTGRIAAPWRVSSFSGLIAGHEQELPDYDALRRDAQRVVAAGSRTDLLAFPRGVRTGTLIHALFESIDFTRPHGDDVSGIVRAKLDEFGFEPRWAATLERMLADVAATPLDASGRVRLDRVSPRQRLVELEFMFPIGAAEVRALREAFAPLRRLGSRLPEAIGNLVLAPQRGFMKGYIDLVFELDGRYYIADYKSNWLGDALEDYAPDKLAVAMSESWYDLQYLLYTVALHRHLRLRIANYDYERHIGGAYYLFVRGMGPLQGAASGVYFARPDAALVERLDRVLGTQERWLA